MNPTPFAAVISSPLGPLGVVMQNCLLKCIEFLPIATPLISPQDDHAKIVENALINYFLHPQQIFTLYLLLIGTSFQQRVWQQLQQIPSGKTVTYGTLAKQLQTSPRAIGNACRTNRIPIIIPCHRIVGATHTGGYAGHIQGQFHDIKTWLLHHETTRRGTEIN